MTIRILDVIIFNKSVFTFPLKPAEDHSNVVVCSGSQESSLPIPAGLNLAQPSHPSFKRAVCGLRVLFLEEANSV